MSWITRSDDRIRFDVRLTPNAGRDELAGLAQDAEGRPHLKARVTAVPEKGKANKALIALIAKQLRVAKGSVSITAGDTSRLKTVEILGDGTALEAALLELAAQRV